MRILNFSNKCCNRKKKQTNKTKQNKKKDQFKMIPTSKSTLVFPGTETGALNSIRIHVSNSRISCITLGGIGSVQQPVSVAQIMSLERKYYI